MNNRDRARAKRRRENPPETNVKIPRPDGLTQVVPMRYLVPAERADYLRRATSPT